MYSNYSKCTSWKNRYTIKFIRINGEKITVSENMIYHTTKDKLNIVVVPNNEYAEYKIDKTNLSVGENKITIKVTAEDGSIKNYNLLVIREGLSNNTNVSLTVNNEKINFNVEKPEITVSSETKNLNYSYVLEDINSTLKVTGDKNLKTGENITFKVVAEDNTQRDYILIVNKLRKDNSKYHTVVILSLILIVGCILEKKKRKKETTKSASN